MARPKDLTHDLLDAMLEGHRPDASEVQLIKDYPEDQFFDVKSGLMTDPARVVREYVTGFANAIGGVLALGVTDKPRTIDGFVAPGGNPEQWAGNVLMAYPQLPPPRFVAVNVSGKTVLLIAVGRARTLVPVRDGQDLAYHSRFAESTVKLAPHVVSDILQGRRAQPDIRVEVARLGIGSPLGAQAPIIPLHPVLTLENKGLVFAEKVRYGVVSWLPSRSGINLPSDVPSSLLDHLDLLPAPAFAPLPGVKWRLGLVRGDCASGVLEDGFGPMEEAQATFGVVGWEVWHFLDRTSERKDSASDPAQWKGPYDCRAALYVLAKNAEPTWYQLALRCEGPYLNGQAVPATRVRLEQVFQGRPEVSIRF